jgi:glucokinase
MLTSFVHHHKLTPSWQPIVIDIDIGGTAIKLGRFDCTGQGLQFLTIATPQPATPEAILDAIAAAIPTIDPNQQAKSIGIGTPGPTDVTGRIARLAINLPEWVNVSVADRMEAEFKIPCTVGNDGNCAALGEQWQGAGRHYQNIVMLTLGTGVGGGIILNGQLFVGHNGAAGELGSISFNPDGHPCNSGNRGSLEQQLCIGSIVRRSGKDPDLLGQLAKAGDPDALAFWECYGRDLGIGLTTLIYMLNPEAIVIGGGISGSSEFFFKSAMIEMQTRVSAPSQGTQLLKAELGNQAGMYGAAKFALQRVLEQIP